MARVASRWSGEETCGFCLQTYCYELEVRCVACDEPICPFCVAVHRLLAERTCPGCVDCDELGEGEEAR